VFGLETEHMGPGFESGLQYALLNILQNFTMGKISNFLYLLLKLITSHKK